MMSLDHAEDPAEVPCDLGAEEVRRDDDHQEPPICVEGLAFKALAGERGKMLLFSRPLALRSCVHLTYLVVGLVPQRGSASHQALVTEIVLGVAHQAAVPRRRAAHQQPAHITTQRALPIVNGRVAHRAPDLDGAHVAHAVRGVKCVDRKRDVGPSRSDLPPAFRRLVIFIPHLLLLSRSLLLRGLLLLPVGAFGDDVEQRAVGDQRRSLRRGGWVQGRPPLTLSSCRQRRGCGRAGCATAELLQR
mmetsp:Transcript_43873/g.103768  ORF Transcript_43873/g.103768 Transcript_43873/m.103768 type:complete len:246 (-) Transcript_43873:233-970(-)